MKHNFDFLDTNNQRELEFLGYTIIDGLHGDRLKELRKESNEFIKNVNTQFPKGEIFNLINSKFIDTKLKSHYMVDKYLVSYLKDSLNTKDIEILPISHIFKPFGLRGSVWHHDSSVVDETIHFSLNVWMPLVNSHRLNGCLWMLPGSHINENYYREFAYNYIVGNVFKEVKKHLIPIYVKAGQIVLFHRNIIHGSSNNYLPINRVALEALIINKGAQMHVYRRDNTIIENKILDYKVDVKHYLSEDNMKNFYSGEYKYDLLYEEPFEITQKKLIDSIPLFNQHAKKLHG